MWYILFMKNILNELNVDVHLAHRICNATAENHHIPWRRLYDYEIVFVTHGEIIVKTKKETYTVGKNQLHIMQPFVYHTRYIPPDKSCSYYGLHLDFFSVNNDAFSTYDAYVVPIERKENVVITEDKAWLKRKRFSGIKVPSILDIQDPKTLTTLFAKIARNAKKQAHDPYSQVLLRSNVYEIIHKLLIECEQANTTLFSPSKNLHEEIINDFIENIEHEYMNPINIDELVAGYGMSKNHFAKVFKQAMNLAPHDYVIAYRIEKAKTFLQDGELYMNEIAEKVGYPDYAYFSRLFKKKEGVSPKNFLHMHKKT